MPRMKPMTIMAVVSATRAACRAFHHLHGANCSIAGFERMPYPKLAAAIGRSSSRPSNSAASLDCGPSRQSGSTAHDKQILSPSPIGGRPTPIFRR
jgi:hypothetical protein